MTTYIALLRGVNVGGKNRVPMPLLRKAFEEAGFSRVSTYINSGNVIFDAPQPRGVRGENASLSNEALQAQCRALLKAAFDVEVAVAVLSAEELRTALAAAPDWWGVELPPEDAADKSKLIKHNAVVVIAPMSVQEVEAAVGETLPEYEQVATQGSVIFWSAPYATFSRSRWSKIVATKKYFSQITLRNHRTMYKLAELAADRSK